MKHQIFNCSCNFTILKQLCANSIVYLQGSLSTLQEIHTFEKHLALLATMT